MNKLYVGDCLLNMKHVETNSVDMIFVDLCFGTTKAKWDKKIDLNAWWISARRILKPNGVVVAKSQFPFTYELAGSNIKYLRYSWIWEKTSATEHLNAKRMPLKAHEDLLVFYHSLPTYNPQKTTGHVRKVSSAHHKRGSKKTELYGDHGLTSYDSTERFPRSVLKFKSDKQISNYHSTQTPVALIEYMIRTYTNLGDTVMDTCAGSGTTGVACLNTGRNYILMELNTDNIPIIEERCGSNHTTYI